MKLLLTRHGQSRWQTDGKSAGEDAPLSHLGELQAHRLGRYLQQYEELDRIVSSNLSRAHKTATIVGSYLDLPVTVESSLREFESWDAGSPPPPRAIWEPAPASEPHPEHRAFRGRIHAALRQTIGDGESEETVLLVVHGGTIGTILRLLLGSEVQRIWTLNTALHSLSWTGKFWLIQYLNRVEHLPRPLRSR
ncbi:MAG: histidine phosphatase family protein [Chloroflexota bacterium]|nr:histidine phosphatase family protein [Chloroflexota bacterium]